MAPQPGLQAAHVHLVGFGTFPAPAGQSWWLWKGFVLYEFTPEETELGRSRRKHSGILKSPTLPIVCLCDVFLADNPSICRAVAPFQSVPTQRALF